LNNANEAIIALTEDESILAENLEKNVKAIFVYMKKELKTAGHEIRIKITHEGHITIICKAEPEGILGKILLAVYKLVEAIVHVVEKVPELLKQLEELAKDIMDMPNKIQESAMGAGLNPMEIAKAVKNTGLNVKYAAGAPNDIKELVVAVKELAKTLKEVVGDDDDAPEAPKEGGDQKNDEKEEENEEIMNEKV